MNGELGFLDPVSVAQSFGIIKDMRVADFGVGRGFFVGALSRLVGDGGMVAAIDVQTSALDALKALITSEGLNNVSLVRADLEVLGGTGLADTSMDAVLLANILFQSQNKPAILKESQRVLKSGGKLIIIDWQKGAGGLGPPDEARQDAQSMQSLVQNEGFSFTNTFDTGGYHYGLIFQKA